MVKKFRYKLKKEGRSLKWFHENYIKHKYTYSYFIKQINNDEFMQNKTMEILTGYLEG